MSDQTIGSWLSKAKRQIDSLDAELIAVSIFPSSSSVPADRSWLVSHRDDRITHHKTTLADSFVAERHSGRPLAQILGHKEFYGRNFLVNKDVLIPRPESESLIELAKSITLPKRPRFLEIGTGSGCLAITLALEFPQSEVFATDLSPLALDVAEQNDTCLEGRVELYQSDLLAEFPLRDFSPFDVLVANLPYVDPTWDWLDFNSLGFEPVQALYAPGEGGLSIYHRLLRELHATDRAYRPRFLIFEADPCQHKALTALTKKYGYECSQILGYALLCLIQR